MTDEDTSVDIENTELKAEVTKLRQHNEMLQLSWDDQTRRAEESQRRGIYLLQKLSERDATINQLQKQVETLTNFSSEVEEAILDCAMSLEIWVKQRDLTKEQFDQAWSAIAQRGNGYATPQDCPLPSLR